MNLELCPEKSTIMTVAHRTINHKLRINNIVIKQVKTTNILGVPITRRLRLDTKCIMDTLKIEANIYRMHRLNILGIVKFSKEWQMLIDGNLRSIILNNNFTILAIDNRARIWAMKTLIKAYKYIFNLPNNVSNKIIAMLAREDDMRNSIRKLTYKKTNSNQESQYKLLYKLIDQPITGISQWSNDHQNHINITPISQRKYHNPTKNLNIVYTEAIDEIIEIKYTIRERKCETILAKYSKQNINMITGVRHEQYNTVYFNTLSTIRALADFEENQAKRKLIPERSSSLLLALTNSRNHDYRIIELREDLYDLGWTIFAMKDEIYHEIKNKIDQECSKQQIQIVTVDRPNITDYRNKFILKRMIDQNTVSYRRDNLTSFCSSICSNIQAWDNINPTWITGKRALMLSGLSNNNGRLEKTDNDKTCSCETNNRTRRRIKNIIAHKAFECELTNRSKFDARQKNIFEELNNSTNINIKMEEIWMDARKQQTFMRSMSQIAFPNQIVDYI